MQCNPLSYLLASLKSWTESTESSFGRKISQQRKLHIVTWDTICNDTEYGVLGLENLKYMNLVILAKLICSMSSQSNTL